jgi:hypothetical protein
VGDLSSHPGAEEVKLSRILEAAEVAAGAEPEPVPAPSELHIRFVSFLGDLSRLAQTTGHPAAKLMSRLLPSMLRDIAEISEETLEKCCRQLGAALLNVADGNGEPLGQLDLEGGEDGSRPTLAALTQRAGS